MSEKHISECVLLEARNIGRKTVDVVWLLREVSLKVKNADRWAITGPTGSGKTLFLRALCLLDDIDEGEILWNGHSIEKQDVPLFRRNVIYLHQRPVLFEGSVEDNLRLPFPLLVTDQSERNREFDQTWIPSSLQKKCLCRFDIELKEDSNRLVRYMKDRDEDFHECHQQLLLISDLSKPARPLDNFIVITT